MGRGERLLFLFKNKHLVSSVFDCFRKSTYIIKKKFSNSVRIMGSKAITRLSELLR